MISFLKKTREDLHRIPETALQEFKTAAYIRAALDRLGVDYEAAGTSTIASFRGASDSWIAFRADIDALPVAERSGCAARSEHEGRMHACGHDGHMANLLNFARLLKERLAAGGRLEKSVMLVFQAAEENMGGARELAAHPLLAGRKVEGIFALHVSPDLPEGTVGSAPGPMSYQSCTLDLEITGVSCHGAQPFKGTDVILAGAKLVEAYQSIVSRNVRPEDPLVITIGSFHAGEVRNIIPGSAKLLGTVRMVNKDLIELVRRRLEEINRGFEVSYCVKINMDFRPGYPAIFNSERLYGLYRKAAEGAGLKVQEGVTLSGSEDFSYYLQGGTEGLYFLLGTRSEAKGFTHPIHSPMFDFDPDTLEAGGRAFMNLLDLMGAFGGGAA
jgi:amidohydrolase